MHIFAELADNGPSGCRMVVWIFSWKLGRFEQSRTRPNVSWLAGGIDLKELRQSANIEFIYTNCKMTDVGGLDRSPSNRHRTPMKRSKSNTEIPVATMWVDIQKAQNSKRRWKLGTLKLDSPKWIWWDHWYRMDRCMVLDRVSGKCQTYKLGSGNLSLEIKGKELWEDWHICRCWFLSAFPTTHYQPT